MSADGSAGALGELLDTPGLAGALESNNFKQILDHIPIAVAVSQLRPVEKIVYANLAFDRLCKPVGSALTQNGWSSLPGKSLTGSKGLGEAITQGGDYLGTFTIRADEPAQMVDVWSNIIANEDGHPALRLVALVAVVSGNSAILDKLEEKVREKDTQLLELQHRVKNNLQMITALIRAEARGVADRSTGEGFDRLAGRVEALGILYRALGASGEGVLDLGIYLSEIASAVMRAHATEGMHLDLQIDTWFASLNVAMPAGLVVNELMTNALKHAFVGRSDGKISLHCTTDPTGGCRVVVADNGVGLPEGYSWPKPGKLSALIVRSLLQNAAAQMEVVSATGQGMHVEITFRCVDAA